MSRVAVRRPKRDPDGCGEPMCVPSWGKRCVRALAAPAGTDRPGCRLTETAGTFYVRGVSAR
ncbi:hypothetical protein GCM10010302_63270 [Streptomyces polychromogenes]|uniref:Uncharacterized protein n=1 Tax=Streptomyces polychromogenes TaxID=67342 RepID=A0ABP3FDY6_9ACTN